MNIYYVYAYLRKNDLTPYYIGKGKNKRAFQPRAGIGVPKDHSKIVFYHTTLNEEDAFKLETHYINLFGRKDLGSGILLNKTSGGEGTSQINVTSETKAKLSAAKKGKKPNNYNKPRSKEAIQKQKVSLKKYREENPSWDKKWKEATQKSEQKRLESVSKQVNINGKIYCSARAAFEELNNIKYTTLIKRIQSPNFKEYFWLNI
jgi:hypothetical protein